MSDSSIKEQMMQLTQQCIFANDYHTALECLQIYKSSFGYDDFYITCLSSFSPTPEPLVSLIYIKQASENESDCLKDLKLSNNYHNLEIICLSADNFWKTFSTILPLLPVIISAFVIVIINIMKIVFLLCFLCLPLIPTLMELSAVEILLTPKAQFLHILR